MRVGTLFPFAAVAVLIVVGSSAALFSSTQGGGVGGPVAEPSAAPSGTPRAAPELSKTARLAYWREGRLWVSGLDGSLRKTIAPIDDPHRISDLLWSPDGDKLAYIDAGQSVVVNWMDGERRNASLPVTLRDQGWRISDIRWSPSSERIAATFLRAADGRADAFVLDLVPALASWLRVTAMNDLFAGDWISDREFLASTGGGVIAVVLVPEDLATLPEAAEIRPVTGALGTSPILASDGRVHFLAGRIPSTRDPSLPYITASRAYVWSAALDGSDVRRETNTELNDVRLDGRLPDGRYLVHRGGTSVQSIVAAEVEDLPTNAGIVERIRLAPDGRTAYGFTNERVVQLDITKVGAAPPAASEPKATVFLDTSGDADVWFPERPVRAVPGAVVEGGPRARYAFTLGGHLWRMGPDGKAALARAGQAPRRTALPLPQWSPRGTHLLAIEQAGFGAPTSALIAVVIDPEGEQRRLADTYASSRSFAWSPDGEEIAIVVDARGVNGISATATLEVRFLDPAGARTRASIAGTEVAWTDRGVLVVTELDGVQTVRLFPNNASPRTVIDRDRLVQAAFTRQPSVGGQISALDARRDGSWMSLRLFTADGASSTLVLLDEKGVPIDLIDGGNVTDVRWSPTKALIGWTEDFRAPSERAVVHEPGNGPVTFQPGRFAGWSLDGEWYYVARATGLFAFPLGGGGGVRVASIGTPASPTLP